jgi:hypothetical protein
MPGEILTSAASVARPTPGPLRAAGAGLAGHGVVVEVGGVAVTCDIVGVVLVGDVRVDVAVGRLPVLPALVPEAVVVLTGAVVKPGVALYPFPGEIYVA